MRKFLIADLICAGSLIVLMIAIPSVVSEMEVGSMYAILGEVVVVLFALIYVWHFNLIKKKYYRCSYCNCTYKKNEMVKDRVGFMTSNLYCPYCYPDKKILCVPEWSKDDDEELECI